MSSPQRMSNNDRSEKPVREKLRNASIADASASSRTSMQPVGSTEEASEPTSNDTNMTGLNGTTMTTEEAKERGRPSRKRSHELMADSEPVDEPATKTRHGRKRSRELVEEDNDEGVSPKRKISGEQPRNLTSTDGLIQQGNLKPAAPDKKGPAIPAVNENGSVSAEGNASPRTKKTKSDEPLLKEDKPDQREQDKAKPSAVPPTSGFANASASSPFGALAGSKSPTEQQTSTSAFKASGFGALSASSGTGFASLTGSASKLSSFASPAATSSVPPADSKKTENDKSTTGTFGGALGASSAFSAAATTSAPSAFSGSGATSAFAGTPGSAFASTGKSAFGSGLGGGFGGLGGSRLGSFASSGTPGVIGSAAKSVKLFGADDEEGEDNSGGEEDDAPEEAKIDDDEKDQRFFAQDIETGEEDEVTEYTCRAKLYNFVKTEDGTKKEWKERGIGVVRLNVKYSADEDSATAPKARLVMRADGSHRVVLNTPILKGVKFGSVTGEAPTGSYVYFMGSIDGSAKLELLQMKLRPTFALEMCDRISTLQTAM